MNKVNKHDKGNIHDTMNQVIKENKVYATTKINYIYLSLYCDKRDRYNLYVQITAILLNLNFFLCLQQ